jgi:cysteine desulfurase / selenocysteine lyase
MTTSTKPIQSYRDLFPVTAHYAYLNHAACSAMPQPGLSALAYYWEAQSTAGVLSEPHYFPVIDHAREKMARLIGADPSEVGWVQNTASAIGMVANGLTWERGDNVVTVRGEFPANVYPWLDLARLGVETRLVERCEGRISLDDIAATIDANTRLLSVSWVDFGTGTRNDIAALGELCRKRGVLFNVDAIQGLGALQIDVSKLGIHFMGAGAHKWLMGPQGVGLLYVRRDALDLLHPLTANWYSALDRHDHLNYGQPYVANASRWEGSTPNVSGLVAFDAVLAMLLEVGPHRIEARILELTAHLLEGLKARGCEIVSSLREGERSGVVCFRPAEDPATLVERAAAQDVIVAARVGVVRVSPHFYNTEEEIDHLLRVVQD